VNEQGAQHSGSRWEPPSGAAPTPPTPAAHDPDDSWTAELPLLAAGPTAAYEGVFAATAEHAAPASPPLRRLPGRLRRRAVMVAAGVALAAAGGVGGFVIGQVAAGDDATVETTVPGGTGRDGSPGERPDVGGGPPPGFGGGDPTGPDGSVAPDDSATSDGDAA
jgi:hypothetical protein